MFEEKLKEFELNETMYPYKCSLLVLDRIQQEVGDLVEAEDKLRGFKPRVDADGLIDRTTGTWTLPSVDLTCKILSWMIEEGIDISGSELTAPTPKELMRQDEYSLTELAPIVFREFEDCVTEKKSKKRNKNTKK